MSQILECLCVLCMHHVKYELIDRSKSFYSRVVQQLRQLSRNEVFSVKIAIIGIPPFTGCSLVALHLHLFACPCSGPVCNGRNGERTSGGSLHEGIYDLFYKKFPMLLRLA
jgi:hypothetical protein